MSHTIKTIHSLGTITLLIAAALLMWSIWVGFIQSEHYSLAVQISAHISTMLAGGLLKVGYVVRLAAEHEANLIPAQ